MNRRPLRSDPEKVRRFVERGRKKSAEWARNGRRPLERRARLASRKHIRRRNLERLYRIRGGPPGSESRHTYGDAFFAAVDSYCEVCGRWPCVPHHEKSVGSGGRDAGNLRKLCLEHHTELEQVGPGRFGERYGR